MAAKKTVKKRPAFKAAKPRKPAAKKPAKKAPAKKAVPKKVAAKAAPPANARGRAPQGLRGHRVAAKAAGKPAPSRPVTVPRTAIKAASPAKGAAPVALDKAKGGAKAGKTMEAFCPRCKAETPHLTTVMMGEKIRRVRCTVCGTEHNFHRSLQLRARVVKTEGAPPAKKKKDNHRAHGHQRLFEEQMIGRDPALAKSYKLKDKYYQEDLINHPIFGLGLVVRIKEDGKIEVTFKDGVRVLAHNRFALGAKR